MGFSLSRIFGFLLAVVMLSGSAVTANDASKEFYSGIGVFKPKIEDLPRLKSFGFNMIRLSADSTDKTLIEEYKKAGFHVFAHKPSFLNFGRYGQDEAQINPDGGHADRGCPRNEKFLARLIESQKKPIADGVDAMIWDFFSYEAKPDGGCFCERCIDALNKRLGTEFSRVELVAKLKDKSSPVYKAWMDVRQEAVAAAAERIVNAGHSYAIEIGRRDVMIGADVCPVGSPFALDLGQDMPRLAKRFDLLSAMIYPSVYNKYNKFQAVRDFRDLSPKLNVIDCLEAGFSDIRLDHTPEKILWECRELIQAGSDGYLLIDLPYVDGYDLLAVKTMNNASKLVCLPVRRGEVEEAVAGYNAFCSQIGKLAAEVGTKREMASLEGAQGIRDHVLAHDMKMGNYAELVADIERGLDVLIPMNYNLAKRKAEAKSEKIETSPFTLNWNSELRIFKAESKNFKIASNDVSLNIDKMFLPGLDKTGDDGKSGLAEGAVLLGRQDGADGDFGNASTDILGLGLLRTRIKGVHEADDWKTFTESKFVTKSNLETVFLTTEDCGVWRLSRSLVFKEGSEWIEADISVENIGDNAASGSLWLMNGIGIPGKTGETGYMSPWLDDKASYDSSRNRLTITDEDYFIMLEADPANVRLNNRDSKKGWCESISPEFTLKPGEKFTTWVKFTAGKGIPGK